MHSRSDNIEIMIGDKTDEIIKEIFQSLLTRYQTSLETSMKGSYFVYDSIDGMYYKCNKISLNRGVSYIDSPDWIKNKKVTIDPKSSHDMCFQYLVTVILNYKNIKNNPERISKI